MVSSNLIINWNVLILGKKEEVENWSTSTVKSDKIILNVKKLWVVNLLWKFPLSTVHSLIGSIYFIAPSTSSVSQTVDPACDHLQQGTILYFWFTFSIIKSTSNHLKKFLKGSTMR